MLGIAIPSGSGRICSRVVMDLLDFGKLAVMKGERFKIFGFDHGSNITRVRNQLLAQFLASDEDCTHLLYLDDDVSFPAWAPYRMRNHGVGIVAGVYRSRRHPNGWPNVLMLPGGRTVAHTSPGGGMLFEVQAVAGGFVMLDRATARFLADREERLDEIDPDGAVRGSYMPVWAEVAHDLEVHGETRRVGFGEDYGFCFKARAAGVPILVDPEIPLVHVGALDERPFQFSDVLGSTKPVDEAAD